MISARGQKFVELDLDERTDVDEVVLAFRIDDELHELANFDPPVRATIEEKGTPKLESSM